jgi:hypothetical protein
MYVYILIRQGLKIGLWKLPFGFLEIFITWKTVSDDNVELNEIFILSYSHDLYSELLFGKT